MASEEQQPPSRRYWRVWSPWSNTEKVRQGDNNTDNFVVLIVSLAALTFIGFGVWAYFGLYPDPAVMTPGR